MADERVAVIDTHVAVWLYEGAVDRFSAEARAALETSRLLLPGMALVELSLLNEIGRITKDGPAIHRDLRRRLGVDLSDVPLSVVADQAASERWTRDPFDRFIVAEARILDGALVSKDRAIRTNYSDAVW